MGKFEREEYGSAELIFGTMVIYCKRNEARMWDFR